MVDIHIRKFEAEDSEVVKETFTLGMSEHIPPTFMHLLKQPLTQMVLMCVFCALLTSSKSFLLPVMAVTLLLAAARQLVVHLFTCYIDVSLKKDLNDIAGTYLAQKDACFWVAEVEGHVVGTVGCLPNPEAPGCLELKRMSVARSHRRMGVAKALCRTVAAFTRERGFGTVVLFTSMVQTDARKLYERMGFEKVREFVSPELPAKLMNFTLLEYRLDLHAAKMD